MPSGVLTRIPVFSIQVQVRTDDICKKFFIPKVLIL